MKFKTLSLVVFAFVLAACAGGGAPAQTTTLEVDMVEFMFSPKEYSIPAGQAITLTLTNSGALEHNFVILRKGVTVTSSANPVPAEDILFEAVVGAGQSGTFTFTLDEAGDYEVICSVPGHLEAGMVGKITVQ